MKRLVSVAVMGAIALGSMTTTTSAAPIIPHSSSQMAPNVLEVWGGCGWGFHPNPWGRCVPNRWATIAIGRITVIGPTRRITMAAGTIHIGVPGIGTVTDASA
jgi:hypothetical protein